MKKLMVAAAIVCAAVFAQAAQVNWGGAIADPKYATSGSYDDFQANPATAVLIWSETAFSGAATSIDSLALGGVANNGGTVVSAYTINATDAESSWTFGAFYDNAGSDVNGYYAVLVGNGDGSKASYYDLGQITGTTALSDTTDLSVNGDWSSMTFLQQGGYTVQVGASVPEPTSGLLLLLGVAGLALRRKQA